MCVCVCMCEENVVPMFREMFPWHKHLVAEVETWSIGVYCEKKTYGQKIYEGACNRNISGLKVFGRLL